MPGIPATQEAEAQKSLEHKWQRLQWAKIAPLHSRDSVSQNKKQRKKERKKENVTYKLSFSVVKKRKKKCDHNKNYSI